MLLFRAPQVEKDTWVLYKEIFFSASIYVLANPFLKWERLKIFEFVERKYNGNKRSVGGETS